jgi:hypothetical protein
VSICNRIGKAQEAKLFLTKKVDLLPYAHYLTYQGRRPIGQTRRGLSPKNRDTLICSLVFDLDHLAIARIKPLQGIFMMVATSSAELKFEKAIANLLRARFPYLYISTWEESRVLSLIGSVAKNAELIRTTRKVFEWSLTDGLADNGKSTGEDTKSALKALEFIERCQEPAIFVLKDFHVFFGANNRPPDIQVIRKIRDLVPSLKHSQSPKNVVFVTPVVLLPGDLDKDVTIVEFELPSFEEIRSVLKQMIETNRHSGRIKIDLNEEGEE